MGENRRKKRANARSGARAKAKQPKAARIVVTLSLPEGEVVSVEKLAKSGKRHEVSQKEFAALAGGAAMQDFGAALEEIYAAGVHDAHGFDDGDELDRFIQREAAGREVAKRGVRKMIVRRVLRRQMMRKRAHARGQPAHKDVSGPHSHA